MSIEFIEDCNVLDLGQHLWSGGKDTFETIYNADKEDELEAYIHEVFCDRTPTITEINDLLWFESESVFEACGLDEDGEEPVNFEIEGEVSDKYLDFLRDNFVDELCYYCVMDNYDVTKVNKVEVNSRENEKFTLGDYTCIEFTYDLDVDIDNIEDVNTYNEIIEKLNGYKETDKNSSNEIYKEFVITVDTSMSYEEHKTNNTMPTITCTCKYIGRILSSEIEEIANFISTSNNAIEEIIKE